MALSHCNASKGFAEKDPGSAVLISDGVAVVVLGVWVDMGLLAGGTKVLELITVTISFLFHVFFLISVV